LSGFHAGRAGIAFHGGWATEGEWSVGDTNDWLVSVDQKNSYRANGSNRNGRPNPTGGYSTQLNINWRINSPESFAIHGSLYEPSDWAVSEIIVYDRELSQEEIVGVEKYLASKIATIEIIPEDA
jgi:hypothetical protein